MNFENTYKDITTEYVKKNLTKSSTLKKMQEQVAKGVIKLADDYKNEGQNAFDYIVNNLEQTLVKTRSFHLFTHFIICHTQLLKKEVLSNLNTFNLDKNYTFDIRFTFDTPYLDERTKNFIIENIEERFSGKMHQDLCTYMKTMMEQTLLPCAIYKEGINSRLMSYVKEHPLKEYFNAVSVDKTDDFFSTRYSDIQSYYEKWMLENSSPQVATTTRKKMKI
jgi:hypothetical protein